MKTRNDRQYSSDIVKCLLENKRYNFWKSDWSKRIIVHWNEKDVPLDKFKKDIVSRLGKGFMYEPALSKDRTDFVATSDGLRKVPYRKSIEKTIN